MITAQELKAYVEANPKRVRARESTRYPGLFVIKYQNCVFFKGSWDSTLIECRGLVVDADFNPVIKPLTKIFNRHEQNTDIHRDTPTLAIRKVNGFMAAATRVPEQGVVVSTTGSLDSTFADLARSYVTAQVESVIGEGWTYLFEIVDPTDPHIIPEEPGAYLIGARQISDDADYYSTPAHEMFLDTMAEAMGVKRPEWFVTRFSNIAEQARTCRSEGFVCYGDGTALKIKSPFYLVSKLFARMNSDKLTKSLQDPGSLKQRLDEEFYSLIEHLTEHQTEFAAMTEQDRLVFVRDYFEKG